MLLNEVSPNCALLSILDKISGNSPNKIHKAGWDKQHEGASLRVVYFGSSINTVVLAKNSQLDEIYYADLVDDDVIGNTIFED